MMSKTILSAGMVLLAATSAWADRLTLKTGTVVNGSYLGGTSRQVRMEVDGQVQNYEIDQVRSISFDEDQQTRSSRPAAQPPSYQPPPASQPALSSRASDQNYQQSVSGVTIPADTVVQIRMVDSVNSETARLGQTFQASLDEPIYVDGRQVVPRGADVLTKLVNDQKAGKLQGKNILTLALSQISINGRYVDVTSTDVQTAAGSQTGRTTKVVGGTAALGAILGAIAGGGTGAAIGAASGAAVGGVATVMTNGPQVKIPSETRLTFRLQAPAQL
ncbi:MAG TPA: hypothetical protein VNH18_36470 [Bryobacteraceae bacterium]|nr:hypothetical protein [Bryobacteraceae bacterium]